METKMNAKQYEINKGAVTNILRVVFIIIAASSTPLAHAIAQQNANECLSYTEKVWGTPRALILAVNEVEGGKPGAIAWNKNRTYDMGPMQFNSATVSGLTKYGVSEEQMRNSECASIYVAGWMLAASARKHGDWRLAIAAYNCGDECVAKAIKKRNSAFNDVSELDIPKSTKTTYVPKVMTAWRKHAGVLNK